MQAAETFVQSAADRQQVGSGKRFGFDPLDNVSQCHTGACVRKYRLSMIVSERAERGCQNGVGEGIRQGG